MMLYKKINSPGRTASPYQDYSQYRWICTHITISLIWLWNNHTWRPACKLQPCPNLPQLRTLSRFDSCVVPMWALDYSFQSSFESSTYFVALDVSLWRTIHTIEILKGRSTKTKSINYCGGISMIEGVHCTWTSKFKSSWGALLGTKRNE